MNFEHTIGYKHEDSIVSTYNLKFHAGRYMLGTKTIVCTDVEDICR